MAMPPRPFSPAAVEQTCRVLGDAVTGSEIPNLIAPLNAPEAPGEETNTKWKRLFNAVATAQNRQQDGRPLVRLILAVMNPVRFSSQVRYDECRAQVNEKLLFSGRKVREDGKPGEGFPRARGGFPTEVRIGVLRACLRLPPDGRSPRRPRCGPSASGRPRSRGGRRTPVPSGRHNRGCPAAARCG